MLKKNIPNRLLTCFVMLAFLSCGRDTSNTDSYNMIIENVLGDKRDIMVSEIVESIELIKLETTSKALVSATGKGGLRVSGGTRVVPLDDYILISQQNTAPYLFDKEGNFIRQISEIGRGPGEIEDYYSIAFNEGDNCIYILTDQGRNIRVFDLNGDYKHDLKTDTLLAFQFVSDNLFCGAVKTNELDKSKDYNYILFNDKGEIVKKIKIPGFAEVLFFSKDDPKRISGASIKKPKLSYSITGTHINTTLNDTIFTVMDDGSLQYSLTWLGGKYKSPYTLKEASTSVPSSELSKYFRFPTIVETGKYWFLSFDIEKTAYQCVLDKSTGEAFELGTFKNDVGEFLFINPREEYIHGNVITYVYEIVDLKKKITSQQFLELEKEFPEKANKIKDMINDLDIEDNAIIMLMTLK